jgi:V/A-type H+-transporting ATPase subunit E
MADAAEKGSRLIEDIRKDAQTEAAKIKDEAQRAAQERVRQFERQMEDIKAEAEKAAAAQEESVKRTLQAAFTVEMRRISLAARDQALKNILSRVEEKMAALMSSKKYRDLLLALVVEAAIGLGADQAEVNASPQELALIDEAFLKEAAAKVKSLVLRDVKITKGSAAPLLLQGIVLAAADGHTAYNNQIRTRLLRRQSDIRKLIYDRLQLQA